jgi:NHLM bacteriocin system ABC transporter peptidase/ATP-binding protein
MARRLGRLWPARRVRTPTVLQMEAVECGAAALAAVMGYYGRIVPLEELRAACGVSRDGTKASNILKAARTYAFKAKGFSKEPGDLRSLPPPFIAFWNFNHFVVVEGFARGKVYLNDPAIGPRTITDEEFDDAFTGVVLVFEPAPEFKPGGAKPSLWAALRKRLRGSESGLAYVVLSSLMLSLVGLAVPLFAKAFVDDVLVARHGVVALPLLLGMGATALVLALVTWLQRLCLLRLSTKLAVTSSYEFFRHLLRLPMEFYTQRFGGEVGARMEINDRVANLLSGGLAINALNLLTAALYVAMMFYFDVLLALVAVAIAALNFVALRLVSRQRKDINASLLQERGKIIGTSMSGLQSIESMKATGSESDFFSRWAGHLAKIIVARQQMEVYSRRLGVLPAFLSTLAAIAILGVGALRVMDGHLTLGTLVAFQALMFGFMEPITQLVMLGATLQEAEGELNRLDDVLRYPADRELRGAGGSSSGGGRFPKLSGRLELRNIAFGYSSLDPPLIEDFNLTVQPGARVALVGSSASGKSTLAKLISGLYQPWSGEVLLDGRPRDETPRRIVTNSAALVDQDFFLYEGSLREVLTMWDHTVPEEDVVQAAKDACIHDDIAARARGYDSLVEEGGRNFSSGQRQRLEIARALVGKPSILVLDEATSALDPLTEKHIDENLRRRGCTCVIVAHRLSTIRDCDEIIVLDQGRVVERGTHDRLAAARGAYRRLIATQD